VAGEHNKSGKTEGTGLKRRPPGTKGLMFALGCYTLLFALQITAYFSTHILVLLAQSFETLSDVLISVFLLVVTMVSMKPADQEHAFGHERAQNVAAVMSATILIAFFAVEAIRNGIEGFLKTPKPIHHGGLAILVTLIGMVIVAVPIFVIIREKSRAATTRAQLVSLARDEIAYVIGLVAVILTVRGVTWADPAGSIFVGCMILLGAAYLLKENITFLVGKAPEKETLDELRSSAKSVPGVIGVHRVKAEYIGPSRLHVDMHVTVEEKTSLKEANKIATSVRRKIEPITGGDHGEVHVDPEEPGHK
jgi:cation diffusion facilitator family transporter